MFRYFKWEERILYLRCVMADGHIAFVAASGMKMSVIKIKFSKNGMYLGLYVFYRAEKYTNIDGSVCWMFGSYDSA